MKNDDLTMGSTTPKMEDRRLKCGQPPIQHKQNNTLDDLAHALTAFFSHSWLTVNERKEKNQKNVSHLSIEF